MKSTRTQWLTLTAAIVAAHCALMQRLPAQQADTKPAARAAAVDPFPVTRAEPIDGTAVTYADPAVPMLSFPTDFKSRRAVTNVPLKAGQPVVMLDAKGPGCVRHIWRLIMNEDIPRNVEIEILVDGADKPQVRMPMDVFCGIMLGFDYYHISSAGMVVVPNFTVTNDPLISKKATPGVNCYLPIPFSKSCRITLHAKTDTFAFGMVDWQQYPDGTKLTPFRFCAVHQVAQPAAHKGTFPMLVTEGRGFVAGYFMGWRQKNLSDMVFHNGGTRILLDGQTDPHGISGTNVEDEFGMSWGFNQYQWQWAGCPYRDNRGRCDQDGVLYRFFGPDPINFKSSISFISQTRSDDYESVVYYYKIPGSKAPKINAPKQWQVIGLFGDGADWERFQQCDFLEELTAATWGDKVHGTPVNLLDPEYGWVRFERIPAFHPGEGPGVAIHSSVYARTTIMSDKEKKATLRFTCDDWAVVWVNGEKIATLDHSKEMETVRLPILLKQGENVLIVKNNNSQNFDHRLWVLNCALE